MQARPLLRDLALLSAAALIGWWAHGSIAPVHAEPQAQRSTSDYGRGSYNSDSSRPPSSDSARNGADAGLGFQFGGAAIPGSLTLYNSSSRTLYVYPVEINNSHINCSYMLHVDRPGAPIERENCAIGSFLPR